MTEDCFEGYAFELPGIEVRMDAIVPKVFYDPEDLSTLSISKVLISTSGFGKRRRARFISEDWKKGVEEFVEEFVEFYDIHSFCSMRDNMLSRDFNGATYVYISFASKEEAEIAKSMALAWVMEEVQRVQAENAARTSEAFKNVRSISDIALEHPELFV